MRSPVSEPPANRIHYHKDMITELLYLPKTDKYVTASRDGTFKVGAAIVVALVNGLSPFPRSFASIPLPLASPLDGGVARGDR